MGREKPREGGERRERSFGQEGWPGLNGSELGASHSGAELGARVTSAELTAMSSTVPRSSTPETLAPRHVSSTPTLMAPS